MEAVEHQLLELNAAQRVELKQRAPAGCFAPLGPRVQQLRRTCSRDQQRSIFQSHEQVGFYAIAALLVGGATVTRVSIWNALVGTLLFHMLIVVVSLAGQILMGSAQIGEYLREFFGFAIIGTTLAIHAWRRAAP